jgi:membrane-bound lytic murein transglycosylase B
MRRILIAVALITAFARVALTQSTTPPAEPLDAARGGPAVPFDVWLAELVHEASGRGYDEALIQDTLLGLEPLPRVIQADRSQAELSPGLDRYLSTRVTKTNITRGRALSKEHRALLSRIEKEYGVQRRFVLAIWAMESRYGRITGREPIFRALATLAWEPRRADYFRGELFNALTMVQRKHIEAKTMTGSWAGAMGQTQFMPSSYLKYAVDFDQDGRRDIWTSVPDALASIANYLKGYGWTKGETWGREVKVSAAARDRIADADVKLRTDGCFAIRNTTEREKLSDWAKWGVLRSNGKPLPKANMSASLVTTGDKRTFLVYQNYEALLGYNCAHYYALSVALLADRLQ